ncbi:MAG: hypothetical protein PHX70_07780 [Clostridium sp.]|nr:hypothetical protein [Clostridium sp.]
MRINNRKKRSISVKTFISELGENFSQHIKERLLDLDSRSFLSRKDNYARFDIKHVEHLQYTCNDAKGNPLKSKKEYVYGELEVIEEVLYLSENCDETKEIIQAPGIKEIYDSLDSEGMVKEDRNLKRLNDSNIDAVVDGIIKICPDVSQKYMDIVKDMIAIAENK